VEIDPKIHSVEPSDAARAIAVQTLAFQSDPCMRWFYGEAADYLEQFPGFAHAFGGRSFEHAAAFATEDWSGVALWLPVGVQADGDALASHLRATLPAEKLADTFAVLEQMGDYHTDEPHWYLAILGVDPARQGRGIGSALLRHSLAPCDEQGLVAYLESSNPANVPLYQRHGFEVLAEIRVGSAPPVFPMLRRPH
jgi:ribosomal protein S18 acetylase RimI-like enzyme